MLEIARAHDYPLVSGPVGTGGSWTPDELRRLYKLGGIAAPTPDVAPQLAAKVAELRGYQGGRHRAGIPLGTDTGGFSSLPGPREDAVGDPLAYPAPYDGRSASTARPPASARPPVSAASTSTPTGSRDTGCSRT